MFYIVTKTKLKKSFGVLLKNDDDDDGYDDVSLAKIINMHMAMI